MKDERPEYPGPIIHFFKQAWSDIKSVYRGEIPRPIQYKGYPGPVRHYFNQMKADIQSLREGKIPRPLKHDK